MSGYKTAAVAKQQASKKFGKNWMEMYSISETADGFEIVAKPTEEKLPEPTAEIIEDVQETPNTEPEELDESAPQSGSVCSALFGAMLNPALVPQVPKQTEKPEVKTGKTVEQNRPEQNGLKRPSSGSTCAIIWDTCDRITKDTEHTCTSAELFNALQGYNECTLRTQYARWRQFNGITGRLPNQQKQTKLPPEWQDALDVLESKLDADKANYKENCDSLKAVASPTDLVAWIAKNAIAFREA